MGRIKGLIASRADRRLVDFPVDLGQPGASCTFSIGSSPAHRERIHVSVSKDVHVQSGTKVGHETRPPRQVARLLVLRNVRPVYMRNRVRTATYPSFPSPFPLFGY